MSKFKCEVTLQQVTPMIHFQAEDYGACLRATDVKPRLDSFLLEHADIKKSWFIDKSKNDALDYRMTISIGNQPDAKITTYRQEGLKAYKKQLKNNIERGKSRYPDKDQETIEYINTIISKIEYSNPSYVHGNCVNPKSFFGNMVSGSGNQKVDAIIENYREGVLFTTPIYLTIFTHDTSLLECLKEKIEAFFLVNNFGTRADKGLGSFYVVAIDGNKINTSENALTIANTIRNPVYSINYKGQQGLELVRVIYALMKGGMNYSSMEGDYFKGFIYRYFFKDGGYYSGNSTAVVPRNDKAFMKRELFQEGINQDEKSGSEDRDVLEADNDKYLYVRAMLGVPDYIEFKDKLRSGKVNISANNKEIERVPSPILFKVLQDAVFIVPQKIDERILGAEFTFKNSPTRFHGILSINSESRPISTPTKFDLINFLDCFMEDFNDKQSLKGGDWGLKDAKNRDFNIVKKEDCIIEKHDYKENN